MSVDPTFRLPPGMNAVVIGSTFEDGSASSRTWIVDAATAARLAAMLGDPQREIFFTADQAVKTAMHARDNSISLEGGTSNV